MIQFQQLVAKSEWPHMCYLIGVLAALHVVTTLV
jgi:hypothetical protein